MIYLNEKLVTFGEFPNGESNLSLDHLYIKPYNYILWQYENEKEIVQLAILKAHLDQNGYNSALTIFYVPHSRMDRRNSSYAFSLMAITNMINAMHWDSVLVYEPHSDVTPALLGNAYVENWVQKNIKKVCGDCDIDSLFFPDAGAQKRYSTDMPAAVGHKEREFTSGKIVDFRAIGTVGKKVLIVDDCCSKGGTLVHSAKLLKEQLGAEEVHALVCYCEPTVRQGDVFKTLDGLFISKYNNLGLGVVPSNLYFI